MHFALRNVSAVVFDAGGTIVHPDWQRLEAILESEIGYRLSCAEIAAKGYEVIRMIDSDLRLDLNANRSNQLNWVFMQTFYQLGLSESDYERLRKRLDSEHKRSHLWCIPDPGLGVVVSRLKNSGRRLGVISNTEDGRLEDSLTAIGITGQFDCLIDSHKVGLRKPDRAIFELALVNLGVQPVEAVYVGDCYYHDVLSAQAAGLRAILLDPWDFYEEVSCTRIRKLSDLVAGQSHTDDRKVEQKWIS